MYIIWVLGALHQSFHSPDLLLTGPAWLVNVDTGTEYAKSFSPSGKSDQKFKCGKDWKVRNVEFQY